MLSKVTFIVNCKRNSKMFYIYVTPSFLLLSEYIHFIFNTAG